MKKTLVLYALLALILSGCAGWGRGCSSCMATEFGGDWVITQSDMSGRPYRCWMLDGVSVSNEQGSDGVYWKAPSGHLVHIAGQYNRVQVEGRGWDAALAEVGMTQATCRQVQEMRYDPLLGRFQVPGATVGLAPVPLPAVVNPQIQQLLLPSGQAMPPLDQ